MSAHLEITMRADRLDCAATLTSDAELDDFVRRLYCAAEGIWPTPAEAGSAQPENSSEIESAGEDAAGVVLSGPAGVAHSALAAPVDVDPAPAAPAAPAERAPDSYELTGLQSRLLDLLRDMPGTARKRLRELGLIDQAGAVRQ